MQSVQESKQELQASIRYAENAISSAKATIESMEFRQEMAKKQYSEQTSLEKAQEEVIQKLMDESVELKNEIAKLKRELTEVEDLKIEAKDQREFDEEVRQGINDFLDYLDTIGYERP